MEAIAVGQAFHWLTVTHVFIPHRKRGGTCECECVCGQKIRAYASRLLNGSKKSCGCRKVISPGRCGGITRKAMSEYRIWAGMIQRCSNPKRKCFENYGQRGIRVCDRWQSSFPNFLADMGPRPSQRHTLDRKNNDGNYEPGNCRWATPLEQARNTTAVKPIEFNGRSMLLRQWAEYAGLSFSTLRGRVERGWPMEEALSKRILKSRYERATSEAA